MTLQSTVIKEYRKKFPKKTLKQISEDTGIQVTRVFRLLNGSEMKLSEYEKFKLAIIKKDQASYTDHFQQTVELFLKSVGTREVEEICRQMNRKIKLGQLKHSSIG